MKRILSLVLTAVMCVMLTSCLEIKKKKDNKEMLNIKESEDVGVRTVDISEGISEDRQSYSYSCDLDYDGEDEDITINIVSVGDYEQVIELTAGGKATQLEVWDGYIEKVYSCDIDVNDDARDIAIITNEVSSDPRIRILSYKKDLSAYEFLSTDEYSGGISDDNWLGYACSYYFNVNDDDTITIEEQTNSVGMWSVNRKYELNEDGVFEEIIYEKYRVLPDFMDKREYFGDDVTDEEKEMWKNGYVMAHIPYSNESISIAEGEYFKPLYDDDNNKLYVEKENGEAGYIEISYEKFSDRDAFNTLFFFLAG